jgi:hypothetical protein
VNHFEALGLTYNDLDTKRHLGQTHMSDSQVAHTFNSKLMTVCLDSLKSITHNVKDNEETAGIIQAKGLS